MQPLEILLPHLIDVSHQSKIVLPVPVQGDEAANAIAEAIDKTNKFLKLRATDKDIFIQIK